MIWYAVAWRVLLDNVLVSNFQRLAVLSVQNQYCAFLNGIKLLFWMTWLVIVSRLRRPCNKHNCLTSNKNTHTHKHTYIYIYIYIYISEKATTSSWCAPNFARPKRGWSHINGFRTKAKKQQDSGAGIEASRSLIHPKKTVKTTLFWGPGGIQH